MRENNRNSIEKCRKKLPQFTTMNVIDGQAGLIIYTSLIFYSLTIDNILNIIVLLILAGVSITMISSQEGILKKATSAKETQEKATEVEKVKLAVQAAMMNENGTVDKTELNNELGKAGYGPISDLPADIEINGEKYTITSNGEVELKTLKVGDEVTYQGENFYVIGFSADKTKVNLLAKYNLKADGSSQDTTGANNPCVFSDTNYWSGETSYPVDLNNYKLDDSEVQAKIKPTDAIEVAKRYGSNLGATGRLMKVEEVEDLGGSTSNTTTEDCPACINTQNYWLGSADSDSFVWYVLGSAGGGLYGSDFGGFGFDCGDVCGVRPVIEVLRSSIE